VYPKLILGNMLRSKVYIVASSLDSIVFAHIFTLLSLTPSMFWQFCWINKPWFLIVGESVPWNTLEVVKINHKSYFQHVTTSHTLRQSFEMRFEGELQTLPKFMETWNLVEPTPMSSTSNSKDNMYSSTHIPPTPQ
jgi:hypothetical protein